MRKEAAGIPIVLWICAAAWLHTMIGGGGYEMAVLHDDGNYLSSFSSRVRERVRGSEQTIEIDFGNGDPSEAPPEEPEAEAAPEAVKPPPKPLPKDKPEAKEPEPKPPPAEKPKPVVEVPVVPTPPTPPPPQPQQERRIAVKQHVQPDQADNPNARFIGDEANRVDKETVATQTALDEDDPNPTQSGQRSGPQDAAGNGEKTKVAHSSERAGDKDSAPGERGAATDTAPPSQQAKNNPSHQASSPPPSGGDGRVASTPSRAPQAQAGGATGAAGADVGASDKGNWSFNPFRPGASAGSASASADGARGQRAAGPSKATDTSWLGLGGQKGPGQINLNLNHDTVVASVGVDRLRRERAADGARRLTAHRGSWQSTNFERWRSAIENYVATVTPGNQTALNTARVPFASYLNGIHNRIHPLFAESFLDSLEGLPETHPLSNRKMHTNVEIVLSREGKLVKMGITKSSGVTAFDVAALHSVKRASPYGVAPEAILSSDGNVYLHWEFHRDEMYACSTMNARPYLLNLPAANPEPSLPPASPTPVEGLPKHGAL